MDIIFNDPISVSKKEEPDLLLLGLDLSDLETIEGERLSSNVLKLIKIPTQMLSKSEAETVNTTGFEGHGIFRGSFGTNFVARYVLSIPMDDMWSVMNGLQVVQNLRLKNVRTPGNVDTFTAYFDDATSVEIFDMDD